MKTLLSIVLLFTVHLGNLYSQIDSVSGNHLFFNGSSSYVDTKDTSLYPVFTVECWVKSPNAPSSFQGKGPVHYEKNFQINWDHVQSSARNSLVLNTTSGGWQAASFGPLEGNTWYHLAGTYDGDTLRAYTNGRLVTQKVINGGSPVKEEFSLKIGKHAKLSGAQEFFQGSVDEVRVWNIERSGEQIRRSMYHPLTGNEAGLKHYYQFNLGQIQNDSVQNLVNFNKVPMVNSPVVQSSDFPFGKGKSQVFHIVDSVSQWFNDNSTGLSILEVDSANRSFPLLFTRINGTFKGTIPDSTVYRAQPSPYWLLQGLDTGLRFKTPMIRLDQTTIPDLQMLISINKPSDLHVLNRPQNSAGTWNYEDTCKAIAFGSGHFIFQNLKEGQFCLASPKILIGTAPLKKNGFENIPVWFSDGLLHVGNVSSSEISDVALFDSRGQILQTWKNSGNTSSLELPVKVATPSGIYFFRATGSKRLYSGKLIRQ